MRPEPKPSGGSKQERTFLLAPVFCVLWFDLLFGALWVVPQSRQGGICCSCLPEHEQVREDTFPELGLKAQTCFLARG